MRVLQFVRKALLMTVLLIVAQSFLHAQIVKGSGVIYYDNYPNTNASLPYGSELAWSIGSETLYYWDRDASTWRDYLQSQDSTSAINVTVISSLADTTLLGVGAIEGDVAVTETGTLAIYNSSDYWSIIPATNDFYRSGNTLYLARSADTLTLTLPPFDSAYVQSQIGDSLTVVRDSLSDHWTAIENLPTSAEVQSLIADSLVYYVSLGDSTVIFTTPTQVSDSLANYLARGDSLTIYVTPSQLSDSLLAFSAIDTFYRSNDTLYLQTDDATFTALLNDFVSYGDSTTTFVTPTQLVDSIEARKDTIAGPYAIITVSPTVFDYCSSEALDTLTVNAWVFTGNGDNPATDGYSVSGSALTTPEIVYAYLGGTLEDSGEGWGLWTFEAYFSPSGMDTANTDWRFSLVIADGEGFDVIEQEVPIKMKPVCNDPSALISSIVSDSLSAIDLSGYVEYSDSTTTFVTPTQLNDSLSLVSGIDTFYRTGDTLRLETPTDTYDALLDDLLTLSDSLNFYVTPTQLAGSIADTLETAKLDSITLSQDSILISWIRGEEVSRDTIPVSLGGGGGSADGVTTAGIHDTGNEELDFTVAAPGSNFSVDISALAADAEVAQGIADTLNTAKLDSITIIQDSILVGWIRGEEVSRDTITGTGGGGGGIASVLASYGLAGDGTPMDSLRVDTAVLDGRYILDGEWQLPVWTTGLRPIGETGIAGYNTTTGEVEAWNGGTAAYDALQWASESDAITSSLSNTYVPSWDSGTSSLINSGMFASGSTYMVINKSGEDTNVGLALRNEFPYGESSYDESVRITAQVNRTGSGVGNMGYLEWKRAGDYTSGSTFDASASFWVIQDNVLNQAWGVSPSGAVSFPNGLGTITGNVSVSNGTLSVSKSNGAGTSTNVASFNGFDSDGTGLETGFISLVGASVGTTMTQAWSAAASTRDANFWVKEVYDNNARFVIQTNPNYKHLGIYLETAAAATLDVNGDVRIRDLTATAANGIVGFQSDGDLGTFPFPVLLDSLQANGLSSENIYTTNGTISTDRYVTLGTSGVLDITGSDGADVNTSQQQRPTGWGVNTYNDATGNSAGLGVAADTFNVSVGGGLLGMGPGDSAGGLISMEAERVIVPNLRLSTESSDAATMLVATDAEKDVRRISIGTGLTLSSGTLSANPTVVSDTLKNYALTDVIPTVLFGQNGTSGDPERFGILGTPGPNKILSSNSSGDTLTWKSNFGNDYISDADLTLTVVGLNHVIRSVVSSSPGSDNVITLPAPSSNYAGSVVNITASDANETDTYQTNVQPASGSIYAPGGTVLGTLDLWNESAVFQCLQTGASTWAWFLINQQQPSPTKGAYTEDADITLGRLGVNTTVSVSLTVSGTEQLDVTLPIATSDNVGKTITLAVNDSNGTYDVVVAPASGNFYEADGDTPASYTLATGLHEFKCFQTGAFTYVWVNQ